MSLANDLPNKVIKAVADHAMASGWFDRVNQAEPKSAPGNGLTAAIWVQGMRPAASGLISTSVRFELAVRLYSSMLAEPIDEIDPSLMAAAWDLWVAYSDHFTLGGLVESVDLLGHSGDPLGSEAGYVDIGGRLYRVVTITLPVKINDAFDQVP